MFGFERLYELSFEPYENGFAVRTLGGYKAITTEQRQQLLDAYNQIVKFDLRRILLAMFVLLGIIIPSAVFTALSELDAQFMDYTIWIAMGAMMIVWLQPLVKYYRFRHSILQNAPPAKIEKSRWQAATEYWSKLPWPFAIGFWLLSAVFIYPVFGAQEIDWLGFLWFAFWIAMFFAYGTMIVWKLLNRK